MSSAANVEWWPESSLRELAGRVTALLAGRSRLLLGLTGPPGAGKSTLAAALAGAVSEPAVVVAMDGFHLADAELDRLGRRERKGAPDTFDAAGFASLLRRIRAGVDPIVYAPVFVRELELSVAGAVAVSARDTVVIVEGNYLLLDGPFAPVRELLDECWYVEPADSVRRRWLVERHSRYGRSSADAEAWVETTDEPNAELIAGTKPRADLVVAPPHGGGVGCSG